jgi:hypothetical protein
MNTGYGNLGGQYGYGGYYGGDSFGSIKQINAPKGKNILKWWDRPAMQIPLTKSEEPKLISSRVIKNDWKDYEFKPSNFGFDQSNKSKIQVNFTPGRKVNPEDTVPDYYTYKLFNDKEEKSKTNVPVIKE